MRSFGTVRYEAGDGAGLAAFWITAEPHVMIRIKSVFPRIYKNQFGTVKLACTPETCRDMEWFMDRYPLEIESDSTARIIREGSKHYQKTLAELEEISQPSFAPRVFGLAEPLRGYQATAVELYLRAKALLLVDQMGLGKTVTAIGSFCVPETLPALVVCQTHLVQQWRDDFLARFLPSARVHVVKQTKPYDLPAAEVYLITYSKLSGWANVWQKPFFGSVIFDEVQELRHGGTGKYRAAVAIRSHCQHAMGLSGTPIYNYGGEIFNVMEVLAPGRLGLEAEFHREWCQPWSGKQLLKDPKAFGTWLREQFLMLRRTREDVGLELPPVQKIVQTIPYRPEVMDEIKDHALELARLILKGTFLESGQAAREFDLKLRQATGIAKAPFVAEFVRLLIEDDQPVVLFGWHRAVYDVWLEKLKDLNPVMFTGSETPAQKEHARRAFIDGKTPLLIMSLRSGSGVDGIQLRSSTAVFGELDWSPGVHDQCVARLNRDGVSGAGVTAYYMVADAGCDPPMAEVLGLKKAQVLGLLDAQDTSLLQTDAARLRLMADKYLKAQGVKNNADAECRMTHGLENS